MNIFILNPSIFGKRKSIMNTRKRQPLSLAYIASLLRRQHQIKLLDTNALDYNVKETIEEIRKNNPEILILTSSPVDRWECPNSYIDSVFEIINNVNVPKIILTGAHGSLTPDWIFSKCKVKFIVRGEPETIVKELVEVIDKKGEINKVKGISYKEGNKVIHNPAGLRIENLDALPFPAYDLLPMERYGFKDFPRPFSIILSSRGCPYACTFCLKIMAEGKYITRSPANVIEEIEYLVRGFKVKSIFFQDWEFMIDKKRVDEICDLILKRNLRVIWGANARADDIKDEKLISKMKEVGCKRIHLGFESGSKEVLDKINKKITPEEISRAIRILRENRIEIGLYALLNAPGEDKNTIRETVSFLRQNNIKVIKFNFPIPYFGTKLFEELKAKYKDKKFSWENIENYAGRVGTRMPRFFAQFYLWHLKTKIRFGRFYFLKPCFFKVILKRLSPML